MDLKSVIRALFSLQSSHREKMRMHGRMELVLRDEHGNIKQALVKDNLIVDVGFDLICNAIGATVSRPAIISHIGVGTSSTAPAAGQTDLQTPLVRVAATYAHTPGTKVFTMQATLAAGTGTGALTEAGVFNNVAANIMLDRVTFAVVNKGASDSMTVTFTFTLS